MLFAGDRIATVVIIIKLRYDATLESGSEVLARDSKAFFCNFEFV